MSQENNKNSDPTPDDKPPSLHEAVRNQIDSGVTDIDEVSLELNKKGISIDAEEVSRIASEMGFDTKVETEEVAVEKPIPPRDPPDENTLTAAFRVGVKDLKARRGLSTDNPNTPEDVSRDLKNLGVITPAIEEDGVSTTLKHRAGVKGAQTVEILEVRKPKQQEGWSENDKKLFELSKKIRELETKSKKENRDLTEEEKQFKRDANKQIKILKGEPLTKKLVVPEIQVKTDSVPKPKVSLKNGVWVNSETGEKIGEIKSKKGEKEIVSSRKTSKELVSEINKIYEEKYKGKTPDGKTFPAAEEAVKKTAEITVRIREINAEAKGQRKKREQKAELDNLYKELETIENSLRGHVPTTDGEIKKYVNHKESLSPEQKRVVDLHGQPVLNVADIEFLKSQGWKEEDFEKFRLSRPSENLLGAEKIRLENEVAELKAKGEKIFPGEKSWLVNLEKKLAEIKGTLTRIKKIKENGTGKINQEAFEDDYSPKTKAVEETAEAIRASEEKIRKEERAAKERAFINSIPSEAFEDENSPRPFRTTFKSLEEKIPLENAADYEESEREKSRRKSAHSTDVFEISEKEKERHRALQAVDFVASQAEKSRAEKIGFLAGKKSKEFIVRAEKILSIIGEKYNSAGLGYKLALAATIIGAAPLGAAAAGAGFAAILAASLTGAQTLAGVAIPRALINSAGAYVAIQALINKNLNYGLTKRGKEKIEKEGKNLYWLTRHPKIYAGIISAFTGGSTLVAAHLFTTSNEMVGTATGTPEGKKLCIEFLKENSPTPEGKGVGVAPVDVAPKTLSTYTAVAGDKGYDVIRKIPAIAELQGGRQTNAIENIVAVMRANPEKYGNIDNFRPGDKFNLEKIKEILETKTIRGEKIIEHAQNLSAETVKNIEGYKGEGVTEIPVKNLDSLTTLDAPTDEFNNSLNDTSEQGTDNEKEDLSGVSSEEVLVHTNISETKVAVLAKEKMSADLDRMFGSKGLFGFFRVNGEDSAFWKELSQINASEIISTDPNELRHETADFQKNFKMLHQYLQSLAEKTEIIPKSNESAYKFFVRANLAAAEKGITF